MNYLINLISYNYFLLFVFYMCNFINLDIYQDLSSLYIIPIIYSIQKKNYININLLYLILMINTLNLEFKQSNVIIGTSLVSFNNIISYHNLGNIYPEKTNLFKLINVDTFNLVNSILIFWIISKIRYVNINYCIIQDM